MTRDLERWDFGVGVATKHSHRHPQFNPQPKVALANKRNVSTGLVNWLWLSTTVPDGNVCSALKSLI